MPFAKNLVVFKAIAFALFLMGGEATAKLDQRRRISIAKLDKIFQVSRLSVGVNGVVRCSFYQSFSLLFFVDYFLTAFIYRAVLVSRGSATIW